MRTPYTLTSLTPAAWERLFGAFILANKSHWRGAPFDAVMNQLKSKGIFEFSVTGMDTWTCKFVLKVLEDDHLDAAFIPNKELSPLMQRHLERMQQVFENELHKV